MIVLCTLSDIHRSQEDTASMHAIFLGRNCKVGCNLSHFLAEACLLNLDLVMN